MDLQNKVAVVTGGAQGLGRAFVEILLKKGSNVAFIDVNEPLGKELKAALAEEYGPDRVEFYAADVSSKEEFIGAFQKIVDRFGHIDIMYNNAGVVNENDWEKTIAINMSGLVRGTYLALQYMKDNPDSKGAIINISSTAGLWFVPTAPIYTATKYAVVGFSRAIAAVAMKSNLGLRINTLCPGVVKTNLLSSSNIEDHFGQFSQLEEMKEMVLERNDFVEPEDVAKASLILVTDESKNGEILKIDADGTEFISLPEPPAMRK
ncbi:15-hydroxyprostaglandin dehydrogenase [NAD(+)]-like [Sinocyclocheilus rhinocerous]|uniref:15-hydroxyprostaglandin dehydrogenase [NAD(+)] n=1 Tax=Sinocyclocheilus rhinocerous TaxID=307959 RepID=A0A673JE64_9TELE|nr:PREDICTED: 15-hydroxyprostaglandin dehydrogenase [NAD(+)]-like [Sinocyclocheilus rhinocerous]